jgi:hypothetical protein
MADTIPADNSASPSENAAPRALLPESTATSASASPAAAATAAPSAAAQPAVQAPSHSGGVKSFHLLVLLIVFAITGVGSLMLLASAMQPPSADRRDPSAPAEVAASNARQPALAVAPVVAPGVAADSPVKSAELPPAPKWLASTNSRKAGYGANIVFELAADSDVEVWRKRTRPVLTMRCAAKTTEVFVITNSPATIEGNSNRHTVKVGFDGHDPVEQTWEHSIDHDALFAPDGASMMRRITTARTMSFSFQPFNAPPATVTFSVEGFDAQRKAAAGKCRN